MSEQEMTSRQGSSTGEEAPPSPPPPKKKSGSDLDPDAWMVTFSDLLTLLMTFFVLIFASQDPVASETLTEAFGQSTGVFGRFRTGFKPILEAIPRKDISEDLVQIFLDEIGALDLNVLQEERGLVITLPTDTYFNEGQTALNTRSLKRINKLGEFLRGSVHAIRVEGHTDNREQYAAGRYRLSLARANNVMERLLAQGTAPFRLSLAGYGPSHPRYDNVSRRGRQRNRRVEIVIQNRGGRKP